jgi:hypothetical protein
MVQNFLLKRRSYNRHTSLAHTGTSDYNLHAEPTP